MKRISMLITVALLLALGASIVSAQSGYDLFQKALVKERAVGDVEEAIRLYERVVNEFASNHPLAAKAELRLGLLYERLGRKGEAQRAFRAVVSQYADQTDIARQAKAKIIADTPARSIASRTKSKTLTGLTVRQVWAVWAGSEEAGGQAAISADGLHLAYVDYRALYVQDLLTGKHRRLWDMETVSSPTFSPDGKLVAFCRSNTGRQDLLTIALDGSAPRVLYRGDEGAHLVPLDWSADGNHILGARDPNGTLQIVLWSVADGSVRVLKTLDWGYPQGMSLSRDGRYVVYDLPTRKGSPERDIFLLSTDGGRDFPLVTQAGDDRYPVWTPDGRGILFLNDRAGSTGAWFLRVVDGKPQGSPELVKRDMGKIVPMGFARNGSFYYLLRSAMQQLQVAMLDPTGGTLSAQPAAVTQRFVSGRPDWSPDGQYLAYQSQRPSLQGEIGAMFIVIRSLANGEEHELVPALTGFRLRTWSPEGRSLLVQGRDKAGQAGIYRVDARTGDIAPLFYDKPGEGFSQPNWFLNGKSIVFIRTDGVGRRVSIVLRDLETAREAELYRPAAPSSIGCCMEASRDGQRLAFKLHQDARSMSVMVMTAPGEKPRELGPRVKYPEAIDDILGFTADGRNVLFTTYDRESELKVHKVWRIAVEGGSPQEIRFPMEQGYPDEMSFHPDGRRIATIPSNEKSEVWVMENFLPPAQSRKAAVSRR